MEIVGNRRLRLSIGPTLKQVKNLLFYNLKSVVLFLLSVGPPIQQVKYLLFYKLKTFFLRTQTI